MNSILIGVPGSRRVRLWQEALQSRGWPPAMEIGYLEVMNGRCELSGIATAGCIVRLESPDDDIETNAMILQLGANDVEEEGGRAIGRSEARQALAERGRIVHPRQWYWGFCRVIAEIYDQLAAAPPHIHLNGDRCEIHRLYDKAMCQSILHRAEIPVPPLGNRIADYDELRLRVLEAPRGRMMVKLRHGSAAAGAMAIEHNGDKMRASTTAELVDDADGPRVYTTGRIRSLRSEAEIAKLVDVMVPWKLYAEAWLPKDRWSDGRRYDLRVLTIDFEPRHAVARLSRSPFTNLNLLNERANADALRDREWWPNVEDVCRRTASAFPGSFQLGIDVLVGPRGRSVHVLEANVFGDLLPGAVSRGLGTYGAEIEALERRAA